MSKEEDISPKYFINHESESIKKFAISALTSPYEYSDNWEKKHSIFLNQKEPSKNYQLDTDKVIKKLKSLKIGQLIKQNQLEIKKIDINNSAELIRRYGVHQKLMSTQNELEKDLGNVVKSGKFSF